MVELVQHVLLHRHILGLLLPDNVLLVQHLNCILLLSRLVRGQIDLKRRQRRRRRRRSRRRRRQRRRKKRKKRSMKCRGVWLTLH